MDKTNMNALEFLLNHDSKWWYLKELQKTEGGLSIRLIEAYSGSLQNTEVVSGVFAELGSIETSSTSREVLIEFDNMAAFNWFSESYSVPDKTENHETQKPVRGYFYQIITKSEFLEFVSKKYWGMGVLKLYRICSLDDIIEVASPEEPTYTIINPIAHRAQ